MVTIKEIREAVQKINPDVSFDNLIIAVAPKGFTFFDEFDNYLFRYFYSKTLSETISEMRSNSSNHLNRSSRGRITITMSQLKKCIHLRNINDSFDDIQLDYEPHGYGVYDSTGRKRFKLCTESYSNLVSDNQLWIIFKEHTLSGYSITSVTLDTFINQN